MMDITYSFMIPMLEAIVKTCHSYGWAIILLTLLVRIVCYPLVSSSTRSMQRMSQLQPKLKALQDRYKDDPELFQKKAVEFYQKNKINPMGGCLPMLVQLPILFALFATFSGPPFGDKPLPVKVKVVGKSEVSQAKHSEASSQNSPYVTADGALAKVVVFPGESTVVAGESVDFGVRAIDGKLPNDFKTDWKITGDAHGAKIDENGHAVFPEQGEVTINAIIPGIAKKEPFYFISGLGKVVQGVDLFKPANWDILSMILLFGVTMWLSQKLMVTPPAPNADPEQLMIQKQTQATMPFAVTIMFFFIPLPAGVYLYMVVSNVIQSLQTWLIMKSPVTIVDVGGEATLSAKQVETKSNNNGNHKDESTSQDTIIDVEDQKSTKSKGSRKKRKK
jgi:YidC/Oxa1 family membrane protein insertase